MYGNMNYNNIAHVLHQLILSHIIMHYITLYCIVLYCTAFFNIVGADIKAVCTEAGLLALRERRMRVTQEDFVKAKEKTLYRKKGNIPEGLYL